MEEGERVRLIGAHGQGVYEVLEVEEDRFRTEYEYDDGRVLVYGREVDDFRMVDYDAVAMLNVSATQQLYRLLAEKERKVAALESRLAALEAKDQARDAQLAVIVEQLESTAEQRDSQDVASAE